MARPVTLVSGQWSDLTLEGLAEEASGWGYDGPELACRKHFLDVDRAAEDRRLMRAAGQPGPQDPAPPPTACVCFPQSKPTSHQPELPGGTP